MTLIIALFFGINHLEHRTQLKSALPGKAKTAIFLNSMPLVDFWKSSPDQIRSKTIEQLLTFAGDGKLRDGNVTSAEFRQFLGHIPSDLLSTYAAQCLTSSFHDSGFALQDIVNQAGRRLGFKVEDGRYRGTAGEVGFDGIWSARPTGRMRREPF
jgi:hypothetical protein